MDNIFKLTNELKAQKESLINVKLIRVVDGADAFGERVNGKKNSLTNEIRDVEKRIKKINDYRNINIKTLDTKESSEVVIDFPSGTSMKFKTAWLEKNSLPTKSGYGFSSEFDRIVVEHKKNTCRIINVKNK